jgi:quinol monooxygenase YgiN
MIVVIADVFAQIPQRASAREAMIVAQQAAREQEGCISFVFAETLDEPGRFLIAERWRDGAALEAHYRSQSFLDYQQAIAPLLVRDSEVGVYSTRDEARALDSSPLDLRQDD